jgi:hypothetical protein
LGLPAHLPCLGAPNFLDHVWASILDSSPTTLAIPAVDWDNWYRNASPGPYYPCTTSSGTPPVFDNDQGSAFTPDPTKRNNSVTPVFNLTPVSSYSCKTAAGELSWDAPTRTLTVKGAIFIDGSATVANGLLNQYNGQGSLYLSGTYRMDNSSKLCAGVSGTDCDFSRWNPNTEMLAIVANGTGGQVNNGDSIQLNNSTRFQGALFATNAIEFTNSSQSEGPMIGSTVILANSVSFHPFPYITTVPVGMPGNPNVYAQPNPPELYAG